MTSKLHKPWHVKMKRFFEDNFNVPQCELCGSTSPPIDIAHSMKRRFIRTELEYAECVMLCRSCHNDLEYGGHERMREMVLEIISKR